MACVVLPVLLVVSAYLFYVIVSLARFGYTRQQWLAVSIAPESLPV